MNYNEIFSQLKGPVVPLPTPFTAQHEVDYDALSSYVNRLIEMGARNLMTTVGTSRFNLLTNEEIARVNETVATAAGDRAITIVSTPQVGSTKLAQNFADHARECGADVLLVFHPERHYGDDTLLEFFAAIASHNDIPLMIHEMPMRNGLGGGQKQYSIDLLNRLFDIDSVIGMKEESLDWGYGGTIVKAMSERAVIVGAGGGMSRYLRDHCLGARAFLSGIGSFYPPLELEFFQAMQSGDFQRAQDIVYNIEAEYFDAVVPMGWHIALKECIHAKGLMGPWERPPLRRVLPDEREVVQQTMQRFGWL